jgi:broad specificity phosphatase PhoE
MQLVCVRHGRTAWNAERRFQGHTDIPLDIEGRTQAAALGVLLRHERFDAAVSSDLSRAVETADLILGDRDLPLRLDPGWREMNFGVWEGLSWPEIVARYPHLGAASETSPHSYDAEGGETFDELCVRIGAAAQRVIADLPSDGSALITTHAGPLHALLRVLLGDSDTLALKVRFLTASVTRFERVDGVWRVARLNETVEAAAS